MNLPKFRRFLAVQPSHHRSRLETDLQVSNQTTLSPPSFDWCFTQEKSKKSKNPCGSLAFCSLLIWPALLTDDHPHPSALSVPVTWAALFSEARILGSPGSGWNRWVIWFWLLDQISRAGILISKYSLKITKSQELVKFDMLDRCGCRYTKRTYKPYWWHLLLGFITCLEDHPTDCNWLIALLIGFVRDQCLIPLI